MAVYRDDDVARREAQAMRTAKRRLVAEVPLAAPCPTRWESMAGDTRVRACGRCAKSVHDLSAMTQTEAEDFVAERRLYRRRDGTVLESDCPEGRKVAVRKLKLGIGTIASGLMTVVLQLLARPAPPTRPEWDRCYVGGGPASASPAAPTEAVYK